MCGEGYQNVGSFGEGGPTPRGTSVWIFGQRFVCTYASPDNLRPHKVVSMRLRAEQR